MKKILVTGAGGFIGGHLVKELLNRGYLVKATDIKPFGEWYQCFEKVENLELDMTIKENCYKATEGMDYVINMACNMGGMGFIENNKALCMLSVLVNTHMLMACKKFKIKKYFFSSSACAYNTDLQKDPKITGLKESDAYPAMPEDGYGWEKLFSERMCRHFLEDYKLEVRIARYHNVYGPYGTWEGGREKAPAALARKFLEIKYKKKNYLEIWGNGEQLRSFMYIDDCIKGTNLLFRSNFKKPINIGVSSFVSINQLVNILEKITGLKPKRKYILNAPRGVTTRSSNNALIKSVLKWEPTISLVNGMKKTYDWIEHEFKRKT